MPDTPGLLQVFTYLCVLAWSCSAQGGSTLNPSGNYIQVPGKPPITSSGFIPAAFVSFSIEFASFPDFAGNLSHPNIYSENLLNNIAAYQGVKPYIRVGGDTQ
jgi:hypothetical protein